jgi:hypothetical protein
METIRVTHFGLGPIEQGSSVTWQGAEIRALSSAGCGPNRLSGDQCPSGYRKSPCWFCDHDGDSSFDLLGKHRR